MAGIIKAEASVSVENQPYKRSKVGGSRDYLQTGNGGGSPGLIDVTVTGPGGGGLGQAVDFGDLTQAGIVRMENLSSDFDVFYGPFAGGAHEPFGRLRKAVLDASGNILYGGGQALIEMDPQLVASLRLSVESPGPALVQVEAFEL